MNIKELQEDLEVLKDYIKIMEENWDEIYDICQWVDNDSISEMRDSLKEIFEIAKKNVLDK